MGSTTSDSQFISHPSVSSSTNTPTGTDIAAGSHIWSAGTSGFSSKTDVAAGSGSLAGFGSGSISVAGNGWVSRSAVGSGSVSVVGMGNGSVSGALMDGEWARTLVAGSSSASPTAKVPSTHRAKLMYLASIQQEFPPGINSQISSSSPIQNPSISVMSSQVARWQTLTNSSRSLPFWKIQIVAASISFLPFQGATLMDAIFLLLILKVWYSVTLWFKRR